VYIAEADDLLLVSVHTDSRLSVVALCGELDCSNTNQIAGVLADVLHGGPAEIVVDVSALRYIDSLGVAAFVRAQQRAAHAHTAFRVTGASGMVRRVFELLEMRSLLEA